VYRYTAVQPPQSASLLPEPFRWLMTAPHSPLAPFFPAELKVDFEGKRWGYLYKLNSVITHSS
jgi:5'-3' exonuclease